MSTAHMTEPCFIFEIENARILGRTGMKVYYDPRRKGSWVVDPDTRFVAVRGAFEGEVRSIVHVEAEAALSGGLAGGSRMSEQFFTAIDKSTWPEGPWQNEPDRVEFKHAGFSCLVNRHAECGHFCGYVAVPSGHPWHGVEYMDVARNLDSGPHGGLTYGRFCEGEVCHVPAPGEPDNVYWLGFDAAHFSDRRPLFKMPYSEPTYRDIEYMMGECRRLAEQAKSAAGGVT